MTIEICSSSGTSPLEYAKKLKQIDQDNTTKPIDNSNNNSAIENTTKIDLKHILDISA